LKEIEGKQTFIMCLFPAAYKFRQDFLQQLNNTNAVKLESYYKCTLKSKDEESYVRFLNDYYAFTRSKNERINFYSHQAENKARELYKIENSIIHFEVSLNNPKMLNYHKLLGWHVAKVLDDLKVRFRKECMLKNSCIKKYNIIHMFDTYLFNKEIKKFVQEKCNIILY